MHVLPVHVLLRKIQMLSRSVRHLLDVVVAVVFIKAPVLNSGDEYSGKLNVSCGKHVVIQNTYGKSETDRINAGNYGGTLPFDQFDAESEDIESYFE